MKIAGSCELEAQARRHGGRSGALVRPLSDPRLVVRALSGCRLCFRLSYVALLFVIPFILPLLLLTGFWKVSKCSTEAAAAQSHRCAHAKKFPDGVQENQNSCNNFTESLIHVLICAIISQMYIDAHRYLQIYINIYRYIPMHPQPPATTHN